MGLQVFLVVDTNGAAGFSSGDMVIHLATPTGSLHAANFEFTGAAPNS